MKANILKLSSVLGRTTKARAIKIPSRRERSLS